MKDFINAFDVNPLCLVAFLVCNTMVMAYLHSIFDWFRAPDWWWGVNGVLFLIVGAILIKHTWGYTVASKYNSQAGEPPKINDPAAPKPGG
jgi:predicted membrane channel-forming protein YqfA (hemolysin III family)